MLRFLVPSWATGGLWAGLGRRQLELRTAASGTSGSHGTMGSGCPLLPGCGLRVPALRGTALGSAPPQLSSGTDCFNSSRHILGCEERIMPEATPYLLLLIWVRRKSLDFLLDFHPEEIALGLPSGLQRVSLYSARILTADAIFCFRARCGAVFEDSVHRP